MQNLVGERGFEPPTPSSRTKCATRLRHSPRVRAHLTAAAPLPSIPFFCPFHQLFIYSTARQLRLAGQVAPVVFLIDAAIRGGKAQAAQDRIIEFRMAVGFAYALLRLKLFKGAAVLRLGEEFI